MKRDLKKWLQKNTFEAHRGTYDDPNTQPKDLDEVDFSEYLRDYEYDNGIVDLTEMIWCAAQKQFLKDILDDIDEGIEKIFNGKDKVKNDKARIVAEEAALKAWLYNKYKYLQRKNGK